MDGGYLLVQYGGALSAATLLGPGQLPVLRRRSEPVPQLRLQSRAMSTGAPESSLWDALRGALVTRALAIVADLGVPEALTGGPVSVQKLSCMLDAEPEALHRLLRALASDGIFIEIQAGVF